ncbi:hypothetical protein [Microbacterium sp. BK668]|uniref:hypothetical protein n=1 Tax=Microbacterium sp. BK668 TaxID=2512118 RepID=UPI00105C3F80|nr:hypothetical protein [Microbacterium sp. BK668]TDN91594.1 hypothetical protein EV279_1096 [Microbacterium sp. BK668]
MPVLLVLLNGTFASLSNVLGGVANRALPSSTVVWLGAPVALAVVLVAAGAESVPFSPFGLAVGVVAGLVATMSLMAVYRAFSIGPVGLVAAIVSCAGAVFISLAGFIGGEALTMGRIIGLAMCVVAVGMLTYRREPTDRPRSTRSGPPLALAAAAGFTVYLLILDNAPIGSGLWSLTGARLGILVGATVAVIWWWVNRRGMRDGDSATAGRSLRTGAIVAAAAGFLDGVGNVALVLALRVGELFLFAILAPYAPLLTALVGRVFLQQRITRLQLAGILLGAAAVVVASL